MTESTWKLGDPAEAGTYLVAWEANGCIFYSVCDFDNGEWVLNATMAVRRNENIDVSIVAWTTIPEL